MRIVSESLDLRQILSLRDSKCYDVMSPQQMSNRIDEGTAILGLMGYALHQHLNEFFRATAIEEDVFVPERIAALREIMKYSGTLYNSCDRIFQKLNKHEYQT